MFTEAPRTCRLFCRFLLPRECKPASLSAKGISYFPKLTDVLARSCTLYTRARSPVPNTSRGAALAHVNWQVLYVVQDLEDDQSTVLIAAGNCNTIDLSYMLFHFTFVNTSTPTNCFNSRYASQNSSQLLYIIIVLLCKLQLCIVCCLCSSSASGFVPISRQTRTLS